MVFNSFTFILFFALVLAVHRALRGQERTQKAALLVASYAFYAAWNPPLIALLLISTVVDWFAARWMHRSSATSSRRAALALSLASNLGILIAFKYGAFLLENFSGVLSLFSISWTPPAWEFVLPVGISFYTFQTLSYSIDVYRKELDPTKNDFLDFALFVSFFPQLVAGPIVRASDFLPQLRQRNTVRRSWLMWGLVLISVGVAQKSVLADGFLADIADKAFASSSPHMIDAWVGAFAFSGQIFFDFAGYSTAAIGAAMCLGYSLPDNFHFPYAASSFSDFWRRWHISLSTWLRDYLYISLGGNRGGVFKTYRNLMLTMLLGGLWHGASWTFLLWGALHGTYLVVERLFRTNLRKESLVFWFVTQLLVLFAWVPFRSQSIEHTYGFFLSMAGQGQAAERLMSTSNILVVGLICGGLYLAHRIFRKKRLETILGRAPGWAIGIVVALLWFAIWLSHPPSRSFIYFQF